MKRAATLLAALAAILTATAATVRTATENFVTNKIAEAFTTNNAALVETIEAKAPTPDLSGIVHGDDRADDKTAFPQGLKFRMADSDGGNMRLRIQDPMDSGLTWYSDSSGTTFGNPFLRINCTGIRYPKDVEAEEFGLLEWQDFTRTHTILDVMPAYEAPGGSGRQNYKYPISAGAFLDYFWTLSELPPAAANQFADTRTMKAASNLVDQTGAFVRAEDLEERAAQLAATSAVPIFTYSAWATDWPDDDEAQPSQPVFTNGAWAVWVTDTIMTDGPFTAQGDERATNLTFNLFGYVTAFWRTATPVGDWNAYGLARYKDLGSKQDALPYPTNAIPHTAISGMPEGLTPQAVSNIVTTALVRERLGVYLYVGADGGIYVHTNED